MNQKHSERKCEENSAASCLPCQHDTRWRDNTQQSQISATNTKLLSRWDSKLRHGLALGQRTMCVCIGKNYTKENTMHSQAALSLHRAHLSLHSLFSSGRVLTCQLQSFGRLNVEQLHTSYAADVFWHHGSTMLYSFMSCKAFSTLIQSTDKLIPADLKSAKTSSTALSRAGEVPCK